MKHKIISILGILVLLTMFLTVIPAAATDTGVKYPGTVNTHSEGSYNDQDWVTPNSVKLDDASYASITDTHFDSDKYSYVLKATSFGFSIPAGNAITGIKVEIERYCDAGSARDALVQLTKNGTSQVGSNYAATSTDWDGSATVATYGGDGDLWGMTWTRAEINATTFGVHLAARAYSTDTDIYVDFIRITVYYTPTYAVNASVSGGNGSVSPASQTVNEGDSANIDIYPNSHYHIASITDNAVSATIANPYVITNVTAIHNVVVTFAIDTFTLTVSKDGTGSGTVTSAPAGISCPGDCDQVYNYGTGVTLTATANPGSTFTAWSGDGTGSGTRSVTMSSNKSVTATFTQNQYTLTVNTFGSGSVAKSPDYATYTYGTVVTLTATPAAGWSFSAWSGDGTGNAPGTRSVTMNSNKTVNATFTPPCWYYPTDDNWVEQDHPTQNKGSDTTIHVKWQDTGQERRTYLKFDLSCLPACAVIDSAILHVYRDKDWGVPSAYKTTDGWAEGTITWNNALVNAPLGDWVVDGTTSGSSEAQWLTWTIASYAQEQFNGDGTLSIILKFAAQGSGDAYHADFNSSEAGSNNPWLEITYHVPVAEICNDGIDNDCDTLVDCDDPDCGCPYCIDCSLQDGWVNDGDPYPSCNPANGQACTGQDQDYLTYHCDGGTCVYEITDHQTLYDDCADCSLQDGWVDVGVPYTVCEGDGFCTYQHQVWWEYTCVDGDCVGQATLTTQEFQISCTSCDDDNPCTTDTCVDGVCQHTNTCTADAGDDYVIRVGESVVLGGDPTTSCTGCTFLWSPITGLNGGEALANPTASPTGTTTYTLTVTQERCTFTDTVLVTVMPAPALGGAAPEKCYLVIDMLGERTRVEMNCCQNTTAEACQAYDEEQVYLLELQDNTLVRCGDCEDCNCYPRIIVMSLSDESLTPPEGMTLVGPIYDFTGYKDTLRHLACSLVTYFDPSASVLLHYDPDLLPEGASNPVIAFFSHTDNQWVILPPDTGIVAEVGVATGLADYFASPFAVLASVTPPATPTPPPPAPTPAHFVASGLSIAPAEIKAGESVTISLNMANDGEQAGTYLVELKINGNTIDSKVLTLDGGQSEPVSFAVSAAEAGTYEATASGLSGSFTVETTSNWWIYLIIAAVVILAGVLVLLIRRRA